MVDPLVESGVLRVRRQVAFKQQPHGVALDAQRGLDADEDVARPETRDKKLPGSCRHHAPEFGHVGSSDKIVLEHVSKMATAIFMQI